MKETYLLDSDGNIQECMPLIHNRLLKQNCCRRAFIRGAFLAAGSVSDPEKSYHFELVSVQRKKRYSFSRSFCFFRLMPGLCCASGIMWSM